MKRVAVVAAILLASMAVTARKVCRTASQVARKADLRHCRLPPVNELALAGVYTSFIQQTHEEEKVWLCGT